MADPQRGSISGLALEETLHDLAQAYHAVRGALLDRIRASTSRSYEPLLHTELEAWLSSSATAEDVSELARLAVCNIDWFGNYVENLGGFVMRDSPLEPKREPLHLEFLLADVVTLYEGAARLKGVDIRFHSGRDLPVLRGDWTLLFRMFSNLVDNAVKYSFTSSHSSERRFISVEARRHSTEGLVRVSVQSYGVGILPDELRSGRLFEYGQRGILARDRERHGSGIGLAEAKRIVEAHGGGLDLKCNEVATGVFLTTAEVILDGGIR